MARTFAGLVLLGFAVCVTIVVGGRLLERRWDSRGFYE